MSVGVSADTVIVLDCLSFSVPIAKGFVVIHSLGIMERRKESVENIVNYKRHLKRSAITCYSKIGGGFCTALEGSGQYVGGKIKDT